MRRAATGGVRGMISAEASCFRSPSWSRCGGFALRALALVVLCTCSRLAGADPWAVSALLGAGNHVTRAGIEAQIPSPFAGLLGENWSWSLNWAGDASYWRAERHVDSHRSLWEGGF